MANVNAGRVRFVSKGEYNNSTQYVLFDLVNYNGASYFAKSNTTGNLPTNTTYWQLIAEKGSKGDNGPTGNGIASIEKTATSGSVDTYTITYTNGNTYNYEVTNGEVTQTQLDEVIAENDYLNSVIVQAFDEISDTDISISLNNTIQARFNKLELQGNTSQTGTPTPSSPIPVNVVSEDNSIGIVGKNIFDYNWLSGNNITISNGVVTATGTYFYRAFEQNNQYIPNTNYGDKQISVSISAYTNGATSTGNGLYLAIIYTDNTYDRIMFANNQKTKTTLTGTSNASKSIKYLQMGYSTNGGNAWYVSEIMITYGSTPSTYEPYNGTTYPIDLPVENLFDKTTMVINGYINSSGQYTQGNSPEQQKCIKVSCKPNTTYTISKIATDRLRVGYSTQELSVGLALSGVITNHTGTNVTITTGANAIYLVAYIWESGTYDLQTVLDSIQIEEGSKANAYTPYGTTPIEMCKINNYVDTFRHDRVNDIWYKDSEIGKYVFDGSIDYNITSNNNLIYVQNINIKTLSSISLLLPMYSNYFISCTYQHLYDTTDDYGIAGHTSDRLALRNKDCTTLAEYKTWLSNHNTKVYYELATPTSTQITYQPLINQLNAIEKAMSKQGQTNISQVNNDLPFILDVIALGKSV